MGGKRFFLKERKNVMFLNKIDLPLPTFKIKGIFGRNKDMPNKPSPCIINLDDYQNTGAHQAACAPSHENKKILWYFDSFGMHYPKEYEKRAKKDSSGEGTGYSSFLWI